MGFGGWKRREKEREKEGKGRDKGLKTDGSGSIPPLITWLRVSLMGPLMVLRP